jgi:hypothetical protein
VLGLGGGLTGGAALDSVVTPDAISDLAFWFKNNKNVAEGQWTDSSGNDNHMSQSNSDNHASVSEGGLLFVDDNSDHYDLRSAVDIGASNAFTMIIVAKLVSYDSQNCILGDNNDGTIFLEFQQADQMRYRQSASASVLKFPSSTPFPLDEKFMITMTKDTSRNLVVYKNGDVLTQESSTNNPVPSGTFGCDQIGGRSAAPDRDFDGTMYELLLYEKELSAQELTDVHAEILSRNSL